MMRLSVGGGGHEHGDGAVLQPSPPSPTLTGQVEVKQHPVPRQDDIPTAVQAWLKQWVAGLS